MDIFAMPLCDLEKILRHLPKPTCVEVTSPRFDRSTQEQAIAQDTRLQKGEGSIFRLRYPSKAKIREMYGRSDAEKGSLSGIYWHNASWQLMSGRVQVYLTPFGVNVNCGVRAPNYISQMIQELAGTTRISWNR